MSQQSKNFRVKLKWHVLAVARSALHPMAYTRVSQRAPADGLAHPTSCRLQPTKHFLTGKSVRLKPMGKFIW